MEIKLTEKQFRRLLDLVYIGNWVLNSTRGDDRIRDYDKVESLVFSHCLAHGMAPLVELYQGELIPSRAFADGALTIPREFELGLRLFKNGEAYKLRARLKYRLASGAVKFWYELDRPERAAPTLDDQTHLINRLAPHRHDVRPLGDHRHARVTGPGHAGRDGGVDRVDHLNGRDAPLMGVQTGGVELHPPGPHRLELVANMMVLAGTPHSSPDQVTPCQPCSDLCLSSRSSARLFTARFSHWPISCSLRRGK